MNVFMIVRMSLVSFGLNWGSFYLNWVVVMVMFKIVFDMIFSWMFLFGIIGNMYRFIFVYNIVFVGILIFYNGGGCCIINKKYFFSFEFVWRISFYVWIVIKVIFCNFFRWYFYGVIFFCCYFFYSFFMFIFGGFII